MTNPCAKKQTPQTAYEVYANDDQTWIYYVLKKYWSPEREAKEPLYARWHCLVISPVCPKGEYGDVYKWTVQKGTHLIANPLVPSTRQDSNKMLIVQTVTDEIRQQFTVTDLTPKARKHKRYQIDLPAECIHTISKDRSIIGPIEFYDCQDGRVIVTDHAWNQLNASLKQ